MASQRRVKLEGAWCQASAGAALVAVVLLVVVVRWDLVEER